MVTPGEVKLIGEYQFKNFNSHSNNYPCSYLTCAAAIGMKKEEIDKFIKRFQKCLDSAKHGTELSSNGSSNSEKDGHLPIHKD